MRNNRFELQYLYNGTLLEKATRYFDANLNYPKVVSNPESKIENFFHNSQEAIMMGNEITVLLKKVMRHDTENYLYHQFTNSIYTTDGRLNGSIAKIGVFDEKRPKGNILTFKIIDHYAPVYKDGKKTKEICSITVFEKDIVVDEYHVDVNYPPNFWMVFSDYSDKCFENNKKIKGDETGILSIIYYHFTTKKLINRFIKNN